MEKQKLQNFKNSRNKILKLNSYKSQKLMYEIKNQFEKLKINENNNSLKFVTARTSPKPKPVKIQQPVIIHAEYRHNKIFRRGIL